MKFIIILLLMLAVAINLYKNKIIIERLEKKVNKKYPMNIEIKNSKSAIFFYKFSIIISGILFVGVIDGLINKNINFIINIVLVLIALGSARTWKADLIRENLNL